LWIILEVECIRTYFRRVYLVIILLEIAIFLRTKFSIKETIFEEKNGFISDQATKLLKYLRAL
jgi:hypothetical protein